MFSIRGAFFLSFINTTWKCQKENPRNRLFWISTPSPFPDSTPHKHLLPQRGGAALAEFGALGLFFMDTGSEEFGVVITMEIAVRQILGRSGSRTYAASRAASARRRLMAMR